MKAPFRIEQMAHILKVRKQGQQHVALVLGARACGLFQSSNLHTLIRDHGYPDVHALSEIQRYATAFELFTRQDPPFFHARDLYSILTRSLKQRDVTEADLALAELVKSRVFDVILTTTMDDPVERALERGPVY